jgi:glycerol-3-phosphate dehydrogenase
VTAKKVISTVGAWTDEVGQNINLNWIKKLRPTKGIHLTLPKDRLPLQSAVVMGAENSDRIVFAIPRHEMVIIGTTDTDYQGSPTDVGVTTEDVSYLLKVAQSYFPNAKLQISDFIASYAGVRPLVKDDAGSEGKTSREHSIWTDQNSGVTFIAGGKYTTYRLIAQQAVDFVFGKKSVVDTRVSLNLWTSPTSYQESLSKVQEFSEKYLVPVHTVKMLCERYGMETPEILQKHKQYKNYWQIEAAQAIETTMCLNLLDFYTRRVPLFLAERNHGLDYMNDIAIVFQELLNLIDAQIELQKKDLTEFINKELAWKRCTDE